MARRTQEIIINEAGRDKGKKFKIVEMSAFDTEEWASLTIGTIINRSSPAMKQLIINAAYAYVGFVNGEGSIKQMENTGETAKESPTKFLAMTLSNEFFGLPPAEIREITNPLYNCCYLVTQENNDVFQYKLMDIVDQIEEASTLVTLKREAFKLHTDFFFSYMIRNSTVTDQENQSI